MFKIKKAAQATFICINYIKLSKKVLFESLIRSHLEVKFSGLQSPFSGFPPNINQTFGYYSRKYESFSRIVQGLNPGRNSEPGQQLCL